MTQGQKQLTIGAVVIILVVTGVLYWFTRPASSVNAPRGVWWICTNDSCKNEFSMSMAEFSDHHEKHYGQPVRCPKCNSVAVKADKCPSCGKVFVMRRNSNVCPACGKPTSELEPQSRATRLRDGDIAVGLGSTELLVVTRNPIDLPLDGASKAINIAEIPATSVALQPLH